MMSRQDFLARIVFSGDRRLLPHQIKQTVFAVELKRSLNASETGSGKFLIALATRLLIEHEAGHKVPRSSTSPQSAMRQLEQEFTHQDCRPLVLRHGNDV